MDKTRIQSFEKRVKGINKKRDYDILEMLAFHPELTQEEVNQILGLEFTQGRFSQIVRDNTSLYLEMCYELNPLATEKGRFLELIKFYNRKKDKPTKKDAIDLLEQIRKEVKGNGDGNQIVQVFVGAEIATSVRKLEEDQIKSKR